MNLIINRSGGATSTPISSRLPSQRLPHVLSLRARLQVAKVRMSAIDILIDGLIELARHKSSRPRVTSKHIAGAMDGRVATSDSGTHLI